MRYEKKVIILSSVLAALLAIWALGILFSPERVAARSESGRLIAGKGADVASISIASPGQVPVELTKTGSSWELVDGTARFPVKAERVTSFLGEIEAVTRLRLVARSKDSWAGFKLDEAQAMRATLKDAAGKALADVYVGGYGPTGGDVYLRRSGAEDSYLVEAGIASFLQSGRSGWLDLAFLGELKEADVQSFSVKSDIALDGKVKPALKLDYALRRDAQSWKSGSAQVDAEAAASLLRTIIGLRAEDYLAASPADAFSKLGAVIKLELGSAAIRVLEVGGEAGKDRYYARLGQSGRVAVISSYSLRACLKSLADLSKKQ